MGGNKGRKEGVERAWECDVERGCDFKTYLLRGLAGLWGENWVWKGEIPGVVFSCVSLLLVTRFYAASLYFVFLWQSIIHFFVRLFGDTILRLHNTQHPERQMRSKHSSLLISSCNCHTVYSVRFPSPGHFIVPASYSREGEDYARSDGLATRCELFNRSV